jgi:hypothetical protein
LKLIYSSLGDQNQEQQSIIVFHWASEKCVTPKLRVGHSAGKMLSLASVQPLRDSSRSAAKCQSLGLSPGGIETALSPGDGEAQVFFGQAAELKHISSGP